VIYMYTTLNEFVFVIINTDGMRYVVNNYEDIRNQYYAQKQSNE
jgi:hypothetical protein